MKAYSPECVEGEFSEVRSIEEGLNLWKLRSLAVGCPAFRGTGLCFF